MNLEGILSKSTDSTTWRTQQRKLIRLVIGLFAAALGLAIVATLITFSQRKSETSDSLTRLIALQDDARKLENDIKSLEVKANSQVMNLQRSEVAPDRTRIFQIDPAEGFTVIQRDSPNPYIPTGSVFTAQLITPIKTSLERTFVMAETTNEYRMDMKRRIPKGSRLVGRSFLNPVLKGVVVEFQTLVVPTGIESNISGLALSRNALPEIDGLYFSNKLETYGTALAFGFLGGFASASRERESTIFGSEPEVNITNQVLTGVSTASFQVAEEILRDVRERAVEYVVIPAGEQIFVALTRRYEMVQGAQQ